MFLFPFNFQFFAQRSPSSRADSITAYEQFTEIMSESLNKEFSTEIVIIIIASFVMLILGVVFYEIYRSNKIRKELMQLAWVKFDRHVAKLKLSSEAIDLLKDITHISGLQDPNSIIKSPTAFENSLDNYYKCKEIESIPEEMLSEIRDLRRSLGFLPLSKEIAYTSTRQFDSGEKCIVQIPEDGKNVTHKGICLAISIGEREWFISRPEGPEIPEKSKMRISLTRPGDAEYVFNVQVLKDLDQELVLSHTNKLNRAQQRNWVRVDVSVPVEITQLLEGNRMGDIFSGRIIDMSGGGFGMILQARLLNGSKLLLNFDLPGQGPINDLPVKVVRVAGPFGKDPSKIVHSVAFEGDVHIIQEQIIQYVFEKQRQDAMIKRA